MNGEPFRLEPTEYAVLEVIAKHGALSKRHLKDKSNVSENDAVKLLRALGQKYPALRVRLPGAKGKGGYWAKVKLRGWDAQGMREAAKS